MDTLEAYTNWMQDLYEYMPNAGYETKSISTNEDTSHISFYAVFTGTHTHEGGPVPPTGKSVRTDYVYVMEISGGKISHLTKIWNSAIAFKQLGWIDQKSKISSYCIRLELPYAEKCLLEFSVSGTLWSDDVQTDKTSN